LRILCVDARSKLREAFPQRAAPHAIRYAQRLPEKNRKGNLVRYLWLFVAGLLCVSVAASARAIPIDPSTFKTNSTFSVDNSVSSLTTAIATIEARRGAPGYSWVRINFYSFPVAAEDLAGIEKGNVESMDKKWMKKASNPKDYNSSNAVIQLTVDKEFKVTQVDMAVPGHTCTIAPFETDVKNFLRDYQFDGKNLRLKSNRSYVCDMKFMGIPNQKFSWDIDLSIPVFEKMTAK